MLWYRYIVLGSLVILIIFAVLQSTGSTPYLSYGSSLSVRSQQHPLVDHHGYRSLRMKKVTALFGETNHLYEAALETHKQHNEMHGYEMQVLRQRIHHSFLAKPAYLLSVLVEELSRPHGERMQWLVWVDPDTIILNPQVPLELFVPPVEEEIHLIGTHDDNGFNGGIFFLRVEQWSLDFLIRVLAVPLMDKKHHVSLAKDQPALEQVMEAQPHARRVTYQPRTWFNAFDVNKTFDGERGDMLVHIPEVNGDKWARMDAYLQAVKSQRNPYELPLEETNYADRMSGFWDRMKDARKLLKEGEGKKDDIRVRETVRRLKFVLDYETDHEDVFKESIAAVRKALTDLESAKTTLLTDLGSAKPTPLF